MKILEMTKRNKQSYFVTLSVSDYDIEMFADLAHCYVNVGANEEDGRKRKLVDLQPQYNIWLKRQFREFQKLWKKFD